MKSSIIACVVVLLLQQHVDLALGAACATNPCNIVAGVFDLTTGYSCYDVPATGSNSVCICPNNVAILNGPCRNANTTVTTTTTAASTTTCTRRCVNGGVCNIVNSTQVCWCLLGFSGSFCELQGTSGRCSSGLCQYGTCFERTVGASTYAYCQCSPGYTGIYCSQCYFTCSAVGVFPDTANCAIGRYYYCSQATGAPLIAQCPSGQRFNRLTNLCDANYNCT